MSRSARAAAKAPTRVVHHRGEDSEDHAFNAALTLEAAAQQKKPRKHKMWVPPAPKPEDGIKEVVVSPSTGRAANSPVRLNDLIQPGLSAPRRPVRDRGLGLTPPQCESMRRTRRERASVLCPR